MKNPFKREPTQRAIAIVRDDTDEKILLTEDQARLEVEALEARVDKLAERLARMPQGTALQRRAYDRTYSEAVASRAAADGILEALKSAGRRA